MTRKLSSSPDLGKAIVSERIRQLLGSACRSVGYLAAVFLVGILLLVGLQMAARWTGLNLADASHA